MRPPVRLSRRKTVTYAYCEWDSDSDAYSDSGSEQCISHDPKLFRRSRVRQHTKQQMHTNVIGNDPRNFMTSLERVRVFVELHNRLPHDLDLDLYHDNDEQDEDDLCMTIPRRHWLNGYATKRASIKTKR
jgi:hypothetical protein